MTSLGELCEKYFQARDFYEILKIPKTASDKEVKKAYHKLSLLVHPDRVEDDIKEEATEKFKVLGRIHEILSDKDKRNIYDETGSYDEDSEAVSMRNWGDYWRTLFKPITVEEISKYESDYKGSETELKDLKRAYMDSKGDMDYILETVPFTNCDEEPRLHDIIQRLIDSGEVPEYKSFTQESEKKKEKRRKKWAREAEEAERLNKMQKMEDEENALTLAIQNRNRARAGNADSFFDSLLEKYAKTADKPTKGRVVKKSTSSAGTRKTKKKA